MQRCNVKTEEKKERERNKRKGKVLTISLGPTWWDPGKHLARNVWPFFYLFDNIFSILSYL